MPDFFSRWRSNANSKTPEDTESGLPFPVVTENYKSKWKGRDLQLSGPSGLPISHPIPRSSPNSLTGFDGQEGYNSYSFLNHDGHFVSSPEDEYGHLDAYPYEYDQAGIGSMLPQSVPPAVIRLPSQTKRYANSRTMSSPSPTSPAFDSSFSSTSSTLSGGNRPESPKRNLKLNTTPVLSQSTHSFHNSRSQTAGITDVYGHAYNYPMARQLSPIVEQDYITPASLRHPKPLPSGSGSGSGRNGSTHTISNTRNPSPAGSQTSEIPRPSPNCSSSNILITRQLNRTISQSSSSSSNARGSPAKSPEPPHIPPLNFSPAFPGLHRPSQESIGGLSLRPHRSAAMLNAPMPTIAGSSESHGYINEDNDHDHEIEEDAAYTGEDLESLHAESFITTSDAPAPQPIATEPIETADLSWRAPSDGSRSQGSARYVVPPTPATGAPPLSESFIGQRWDRDAALGSGVVTFRAKPTAAATPACWAFWLGFFFPILWLIGGWHFTRYGEQPPRVSFWEFYFYKALCCCGGRRNGPGDDGGKGKGRDVQDGGIERPPQPRVPRWVTEKQSSDDGRMRLQDPKRSLRGISFGYPFVARPVSMRRSFLQAQQPEAWSKRATRRVLHVLQKPNRLFDHFYGVKLREVRGRPESGRRIFDPWIQRCRYAFCYGLILLCVGLCAACTFLIVFNTRQLR
ncbi:hypothetical protein H0H81_000032 [Sphagnurus paluster]|uniref:Uncharacterized protein n=1 Tax=Sphagnurus paluster TaxID=117069 RepID=A0A9P7FW63_9AGAR|nr:hypothetical protein H0H81_000032 [Sphagnurus paluster]